MSKIKITFPDDSVKEFEKGCTGLDIANSISEGLGRAALAIKVNDEAIDITTPINDNARIQILTFKDPEGKDIFWHSASHLMTQAILRLHKNENIGLGVGFAIENGYYQDYDITTMHPEDLEKIEQEMKKIVKEKLEITHKLVPKKEALEFYKHDPYKTEMIHDVPGDNVTFYHQGEFANLCKGPHIPNTKMLKSFKLTKIAGAYWRGDAKNKQLQRIYGVAFPDKKDLKEYLHLLEEAQKRDHRKIGKQMDLFSFHDEAPGMPIFHPKGMVIWNELMDFWNEEHKKDGYVLIKTPILMNRKLWETSGHWMNYRENMYETKIDEMEYAIKPMNCPGGMKWYANKIHSYKEFPIRAGEIGLVHRHELSGVLSGLFRVRAFHQDDAHIFMTNAQITSEVLGVLNLIDRMYRVFGLTYHLELSTRPEKSIGSDEQWEAATKGLKGSLEEYGMEYDINEGDGAFYGPKIDVHIKDAIGRTWQCATVQLDMSLPERFDLTYEGDDGKKHRPVMIHRVIYGAIERFFGILIEHYAGKFPLWLSPIQVRVLTVADRHNDYAEFLKTKFEKKNIRVELDLRAESINKKVRESQLDQVNYILVVGDKEQENQSVNIRTRDNQVHGEKNPDEFIDQLIGEIEDKK
ncbi:threonine--tRNA ligase [Nanoarchaeota archaeon]